MHCDATQVLLFRWPGRWTAGAADVASLRDPAPSVRHGRRGAIMEGNGRPFHPSDPRHRPRRDRGVDRFPRRHCGGLGPGASPLHRGEAAGAGQRAAARRPPHDLHPIPQHDPRFAAAVLPRRRASRAAHPQAGALERGRHGHPGQQGRRRHRRAPVHLRLLGRTLRGRVQPLLQGQGRRSGRRPHLLPGPRRTGRVRPRLPRGAPRRGASGQLPDGGGKNRAVELPPPTTHARLLGVPHRVDGPGPHPFHLPRPLQPLHAPPPHRRHLREHRVVLRGRRRVRRARDARGHLPGRAQRPRQPQVGGQLQPPAPRRPGEGQQQDHPGARGRVPRSRLERDQGDMGLEVGRAADARHRRRAAQQDVCHRRRRVPALRG